MEEIIRIENLRKTFANNVEILKGISFSVNKGDVVSIIGPSGSGKSTILRCISQLEKISDGSITICGENLVKNGIYVDKKIRQKIILKSGLVFQNFNLFPHYSVIQNVMKPQIQILKKNEADAKKTSLELLDRMGLSEKINNYPCELSGGQQQRVSIARALALKPEVLLFDEPTSALDPELTGEILTVIKELANEKMTMVVVTHEMSFARDISNHIIFIDNGVIIEKGNPKQIINNPKHERLQTFLSRFNR